MGVNNSAIFNASMILTKNLAPFIANVLKKEIGDVWWKQVIDSYLDRDTKLRGISTHQERIDNLDFGRCKKILVGCWERFFRLYLPERFKTNLSVAYQIYNKAKHTYIQTDMPESEAIQGLSTMCLLMEDLNDKDSAYEIKQLISQPMSSQNIATVCSKSTKNTRDFTAEVIEMANSVKAGEIATYADLSQILKGKGIKSYSQTIATIIKNNADLIGACHRIVGKNGLIKTEGKYNNTSYSQAQLLQQEGIAVTVRNGKEYSDVKKRKWPELDL